MYHASTTSVLKDLRSVIPQRIIDGKEALRIAELQANKLLARLDDAEFGEVPLELVASLPRIRVVFDQVLPKSGASFWNGREWIIAVSAHDSHARQRFTVFHEYKHIIDHGSTHLLYSGTWRASASQQAEHAADYFAGCVLASRRSLKSAWGQRIQRPADLAQIFGMSQQAVRVRISQLGLLDERPRCATVDDDLLNRTRSGARA